MNKIHHYLKNTTEKFKDWPVECQAEAELIGKSNFQSKCINWHDLSIDDSFMKNKYYRLKPDYKPDALLTLKRVLTPDQRVELMKNKKLFSTNVTTEMSPSKILSGLFVWYESVQGYKYWEQIKNAFETKGIQYDPTWPIGTKIIFKTGRYGTVCEAKENCTVRDGKSLLLDDGNYSVEYWSELGKYGYEVIKVELPTECHISARDILKHALTPEQFNELQKCDVRREVLESGIQDASLLILGLFEWRESPQGYTYWQTVFDNLSNYKQMTKVRI